MKKITKNYQLKLLMCAVVFALFMQQAVAKVWYVGTTTQWADKDAGDVFETLQDAYAAAAASGDEIWIAEGTYIVPTLTVKNIAVYGSFVGTESSIDERGKTAGGKPWEFAHPTILNNSATGTVGAIFNRTTTTPSAFIVDGITFDGETVSGSTRRAINIAPSAAMSDISSTNRFSNCIFKNYKVTGDGGALNLRDVTEVYNCLLTNNAANKGAAGYLEKVTIHDCDITNNSLLATGTNPVGSGSGCGGGIFLSPPNGSSLGSTAYNLYVSGNSATFAGGIFARNLSRVYNCVIVNNTATISGGGLAFDERDNDIAAYNLTIANNSVNSATGAGGVCFTANGGNRTLQRLFNTILLNNTNGAGDVANVGVFNTGTFKTTPVFKNNLIDRTDYSTDIDMVDCIVATDPATIFDANMATIAGSPAVDRGTSTVDGVTDFPATDIAGNVRVAGLSVDIGAYEVPYLAVTGISIQQGATFSLVQGTYETLISVVEPGNASNQHVVWTSSDPATVTVDETGRIFGVIDGTATVTVTTEDGVKTADCVVTVAPPGVPVTGVTLDKTSYTFTATGTLQLTATVQPTDATTQVVAWTSSAPAVATVDNNGLVTATGNGDAIITATTQDGAKTATCDITVAIAVTGVTLDRSEVTLSAGNLTDCLLATVMPANALNKNVKWSSSVPSIVQVSDNGQIMPLGSGSAIITATTEDGNFEDACTVTVAGNIKAYTFEPLGDTYINSALPDDNFGASDRMQVANGGATVTRYAYLKYSVDDLMKNVTDPGAVKIALSLWMIAYSNSNTVPANLDWVLSDFPDTSWDENSLTWNNQPEGTPTEVTRHIPLSYTNATDPNMNAVFDITDYVLQQHEAGIDTVTLTLRPSSVQTYGAWFASKEYADVLKHPLLTVSYVGVESIQLDETAITLDVSANPTATLAATVLPDEAYNKNVTWSSDKPSVATVSDSGEVAAVSEGTATITATTVDGAKTANCTVTVTNITGLTGVAIGNKVVSEKFYTVTGIEVPAPTTATAKTGNILIKKTVFESGKTAIDKVIF